MPGAEYLNAIIEDREMSTMKNHDCPHLNECKQFVQEQDYDWYCLGKISWNQENCFKTNGKGIIEMRRLPLEWWTIKLLDRYRQTQSGKEKPNEK